MTLLTHPPTEVELMVKPPLPGVLKLNFSGIVQLAEVRIAEVLTDIVPSRTGSVGN